MTLASGMPLAAAFLTKYNPVLSRDGLLVRLKIAVICALSGRASHYCDGAVLILFGWLDFCCIIVVLWYG